MKYDKALLEEICERDGCSVDFTLIEKYNRDIFIEFACHCGNIHSKKFCLIYKFGGFCRNCTKNNGNEKKKKTCMENWGVEHPSQNKDIKEKKIKTCIENWGVENPSQNVEITEKKKKTCIKNWGVEHSQQNAEVREKSKTTCIENWGVEHPSQNAEIKEKSKQTCVEKYGVENPFQNAEVKEKIKQKCVEKYGVENPSQNAEIAEKQSKNAYKLKEFIFPCGSIIKVQGYEAFLLKYLVDTFGYTIYDIIVKRAEVPTIWYSHNNKKCRYYCDVYIPKTNTIYEVKSTWTYNKAVEKNLLKEKTCVEQNFNFELFIFDRKG